MTSFTNAQRNANEDNHIFSFVFQVDEIFFKVLNFTIAAKSTKGLALLSTVGRGSNCYRFLEK